MITDQCLFLQPMLSMAPTEAINYRLSFFFNLSFIGDKLRAKNDKNSGFLLAFSPEKQNKKYRILTYKARCVFKKFILNSAYY